MLNRIRWEVRGLLIFCWYWVNCWLSQNVQNVWFRALSIHYVINITKWEVVVYFVDMGWINIVDQQYLNTWGAQGLKPYILCSMIRGEENVVHFFFYMRWIVDHQCLNTRVVYGLEHTFCVQWYEGRRGGCSFCWYGVNYWP